MNTINFKKLLFSIPLLYFSLILSNPNQSEQQLIPGTEEISFKVNLETLNNIEKLKDHDKLLTLVIMVKDEEHVVVPTLKTYVESGINYVLLFDTGSTDRTIQFAEEYLKSTNTNYFIKQEPFINFAASRNRGLRLAEELFPENTFMVMPDAEWYLHGGQELLNFCRENKNDNNPCYLIKILNRGTDFGMPRLIRAHRDVKFIGRVHEVPSVGGTKSVPATTFFELGVSQKGYEKSKKRWERDAKLLFEDFMENPGDSRTAFYLAQTHHCLGNFKEAYKYYKYRSKMVGWPEEDFMTLYRLGQICENMTNEKDEPNWPEALYWYLEAWSFRPHRVEPLIKISRHYVKDRFPLAHFFSKKACDTPYPAEDILFIDKMLYDYDRYDVLSLACWYLGDYEAGDKAVKEALKSCPDYPHLKRNLGLYADKLKELAKKDSNNSAE